MKKTSNKKYSAHNNEKVFEVNEPAISFLSHTQPIFFNTPIKIREKIQEGVAYQFLDKLQTQLNFSEDKWADILSLSTKSLQRYKKEKDFKFKPIHSEKLIEIAEVVALGNIVFHDSDKFNTWLSTENLALARQKPQDLISDSYGKQLVIDELNRIEHGIFA
jgi:putative toxin-antitoxin system antitoxin component (TIGR02293 family)